MYALGHTRVLPVKTAPSCRVICGVLALAEAFECFATPSVADCNTGKRYPYSLQNDYSKVFTHRRSHPSLSSSATCCSSSCKTPSLASNRTDLSCSSVTPILTFLWRPSIASESEWSVWEVPPASSVCNACQEEENNACNDGEQSNKGADDNSNVARTEPAVPGRLF